MKDCLQKRIRVEGRCSGNHLGCLKRADKGLRYGLSGDRVALLATERLVLSRETTPTGDGEQCKGKTYPTYAVRLTLSAAIIFYLLWRLIVKKHGKKKRKTIKIRPDLKWITTIFGSTLGISAAMSFLSNEVLSAGGMVLSFVVLLSIVLLGIVFDILGVAVTAASEQPFHSMASKKVPEALTALKMLRRAERVSSFCNDVVGDICGVVSGSASAVIAARVVVDMQPGAAQVVQLFMSALVAALTVGGKAFGKSIAMGNSEQIIHAAAKLIYGSKRAFGAVLSAFRRG